MAADGTVERWIWRQAVRLAKQADAVDAVAAPPDIPVPGWLRIPVAPVTAPPVINPSRVGAPDEARLGPSDLAAITNPGDPALLRGRVLHRLLEVLPDLPPGDRERAGMLLATRACLGDSGLARALVDEVLLLMSDPDFAPCFGPGARAEVPVIGRLTMQGRPDSAVSGRVDRLVVTGTSVLVLDFKTDRTPPATVPETYVAQLAIYAALLRQVFPGHEVKTGVIWTALPRLDVIDAGASGPRPEAAGDRLITRRGLCHGAVALGNDGADHQLDLVEDHQRQDDHADIEPGEQDIGHGHAAGQRLLRPAHDDGDLVGPVKAQPRAPRLLSPAARRPAAPPSGRPAAAALRASAFATGRR